uniref:Uncharacterized protein n=1 Tax=Rangifer tarandus platyrhynchus TaxID=3082113 RepID=A0ACB0EJG4_RANTA|nr:unnamed protein product [Rangifer tarandus platyrhynchus]
MVVVLLPRGWGRGRKRAGEEMTSEETKNFILSITSVGLLGSAGVEGLEFYAQETPTGSNRSLHPNSSPGGARGGGAPPVRARPVANVPGKGFAQRRPGTWSARYTSTEGVSASRSPLPSSQLHSLALLSLPEPQHSPAARRRPRPFFRPPDPPPARPSSGSPPSPRRTAGSSVLAPYPRPPLAGPPRRGPPRPPARPPPGDSGPFHNSAARLPPLGSRFTPARCSPSACALRSAAAAAAVAAPSGSVFLKGNAEASGVTVGEGDPESGDPRGGPKRAPGMSSGAAGCELLPLRRRRRRRQQRRRRGPYGPAAGLSRGLHFSARRRDGARAPEEPR